ncbi:MAG TPA: 5'-3' exonuclease H3TH domain-containing protein, partial [Candidatus Limnocylindrales bacterium]
MERLMLLDANGLIYRAYFALYNTPLTTSHGELVNAVFGFWSIVLRGFQDVRPDYVIACFDLAGPTFRHEAFAEYKATRRKMPDDLRDQFPKVRELIEAFRIPIHQLEGWEADDLIGTLARQAEADGLETTIVSGDLDMLQLVSEQTSVMTTRGGVQQTVVYDPSAVFERYGLTPDQMIDFKALKGDTTDNIPGIPGVGDKTAAKLLIDFGSLDAVYAEPERVTPEKLRLKVIEHRDQVTMNRQLVTIHRDLPVELDLSTARLGDYDRAEVMRLFREYEFRSLVERLPGVDGEAALAPGELLRQEDGTSPIPAAIVPGRVLASRPRGGLSGEGSGLQLTLDFAALSDGSAAVATAGEAPPALADEPPAVPGDDGGSAPRITALPGSAGPADRLRALLRDPALAEPFAPGDDPSAWLAAQATVAIGLALDDPRPRRGTLLGLAVGGADGRLLAAGPDDAERLLTAIASVRAPLTGHDVKRVLVAELARRDPEGTAGPVHRGVALPPIGFDTQIAAYILNAALRSQTLTDICAERLDVELPAAGTLGGRDHAAVEAAAVA